MTRQEAQELLPWFVAGTLSDDETRAVQAFIDSGEIRQAELDELALFSDTISEQTAHEPAYNPGVLENVMQQLDDVAQAQPDDALVVGEARRPAQSAGPGVWTKLKTRFAWDATPAFARLTMAAQFAAVLALALIIAAPDGGDTTGQGTGYTTVAGSVSAAAADFTVGFAPNVTEAQLRELLMANKASIVAGPNSLGMYEVAIGTDADKASARDQLAASALTVFVQPVAAQ